MAVMLVSMWGCVANVAESTEEWSEACSAGAPHVLTPEKTATRLSQGQEILTSAGWCACQVLTTPKSGESYFQNYDCASHRITKTSTFNPSNYAITCTIGDSACYGVCFVDGVGQGWLATVTSNRS